MKRKHSLMVEITIVAVGMIRYKEKRKRSTCHSLDLLSHHLRLLLGQSVCFFPDIFLSSQTLNIGVRYFTNILNIGVRYFTDHEL